MFHCECHGVVPGGSGSPPGAYTQEIPPRHPQPGFGFHHSGPPILPPHLLQVILNKETSSHVSDQIYTYRC